MRNDTGKFRRLCFTVFFCMVINLLFAQDVSISFSHLSSDNGLPTNQFTDVLQDSRGFWWIASYSGLSRFDGSNFKHFTKIDHDSTSLIDDKVYALFEDTKKRLWVMTTKGMCVYDPLLDRFSSDITPIFNEYKIPPGSFEYALTDSAGNFWMLHSQGLFMYDKMKQKTIHVDPLPGEKISHMCEGRNGEIWIIYHNGSFVQMSKNLQVIYANDQLANKHGSEDFHIKVDHDGDLWIYAATYNIGMYFFNSRLHSIRHINTRSDGVRLNSDIVRDVETGENNLIWVSTDHGGVNIIDKKTWNVNYLSHDPLDKRSLSDNTTTFIYKDKGDVIWIGTYKHGLNYFHKDLNKFKLYQSSFNNSSSLPYNDVNAFEEDRKGNLWVGTNGGGLVYFDRKNNSFMQYLHDPNNPASLASDVIVSLYLDRSDHLWIGTYFGGLDYFDGSRFVHFKHSNGSENQISDNSVWDIEGDSEDNIWIGTLLGSLDKYDTRTGKFSHYGRAQGIYSNYISSILVDVDSSIWVGTGYGVSVLRKGATKFSHFEGLTGKGSLSSNQITCMYRDHADVMWIGTQEGLNIYDQKTKTFRHLKTQHGLPDNDIMGIVVDDKGKVWITTAKGVSALTIRNFDSDSLMVNIAQFDETDGLQGKQFNHGAIFKSTDGHLFFGGTSGFNELIPSALKENKDVPSVVFSRLLIDNNEVQVGQEVHGRVTLTKSITDTDEIVLSHGYNSFSLEFSILTLVNNSKSRCRYKLVGFDNDWVQSKSQVRSAHYTSIDAGTYEFIVSVSTNGVWHDGVKRLKIKVLPPVWRSNLAFFFYSLIALLIAFFARRFLLLRERVRYEQEKQEEERKRTRAIDRMKIKFITNVSHEFRTPLTLILTPIESLLKKTDNNIVIAKNNLELIHRNARRLLNLVNQLLDFRRLELEEVKLNASEGDIVSFIKEVTSSFSDLAERKRITFSFESKLTEVTMLFDSNKIERILFNLISNAFKFTPQGGAVTVRINHEEKADRQFIRIDVEDSGIGIATEHVDKIFDRFFQSDLPSNMMNEGNGIGLSITREFVRLHEGEITVRSRVNYGSCFSVLLPIQKQVHLSETATVDPGETPHQEEKSDATQRQGKRILLLVEDNEDLRFYLKDNLKHGYQVEEASNGAEGWRKALELLPDMIVSDIMMPEMNGIELCTKIRADVRTSHIPLILLTARSSEEQRLEGLQIGADDYVVKPFNFEILQARIRNLISLRAKFHKKIQQNFAIQVSEVNISSLDQMLIEKAVKVVETYIEDPEFSVEELSKELGISRAHLYRKLLSLTGKSALEFIRIIRLQRAAQLLEKSQLTIAEIAYKVGFNTPKYFTKYFKEHYKILPSAYARKQTDRPGS
jgi:signal transduction histidine kinase/ligand-binding sensor domain-containing protein/DNA-binding response OmpR family regulator